MRVINLTTNNLINPIGYEYESLNLSWQVTQSKSGYSKAVQVSISKSEDMKNVIYDSGVLNDYRECNYFVSLQLEPRTRYYWQVWIQGEQEEAVSEVAFFETGKREEKWRAKWIGVPDANDRMPCIYKDFLVESKCESARIYLYGLGIYEAYLNGNKIGEEYLLPGYHSYDLNMQYQTFDITEYVREGNNHFEIILGEGWYKGRFGFDGDYKNLYGDQKKCIVEIHLSMQGESDVIISSDETWKARESNILQNGIYDGEWIDETLEQNEKGIVVFDDDKDLLKERINPPIKKTEVYEPVHAFTDLDGFEVYDFGKIITGWVEVKVDFKKGQEISFYYGEVLQNGSFYNDNLRTAQSEFHYVSLGGSKVVRPHFTYYGFRYIKVKGIKKEQIEEIFAYQIMSDIKETGFITTSNEKVNQLFANTKQSQKCNFLDIPTDCPQRDERMGWTGDVAIFAETACFHMNSSEFFHHYLRNLKKEQELQNGAVPFFVPTPKITPHEEINPFYISSGASVWGDVATILPWTLYQYYGNKERLREHFSIMTGWVDYISKRVEENPIPFLWQNDRQLGDWLALDNNDIYNPIGKTDTGFIASAYYYYSAMLCGKTAKELQDVQEEKYTNLAGCIKEAFINEYFDETNSLKIEVTQTACAILLYMGLYPECGKERIVHDLEKLLLDNENHLNTGFVGTPILCPALSENGLNHLAYTLLLNEEYPSWLYEVNLGATTIWERWNSLLEDGTISGTDMNSLNHYAYGSIADWMYRYMCGFHPSMEKEIKMTLKPMPDKRLQEVKGSWESPYGTYVCEWKVYEFSATQYKIEIPFNANAKVTFPNSKEQLLTAGVYYFDNEGNLLLQAI